MGSSIRNPRDMRFQVRTYRETRGLNNGDTPAQKNYQRQFTEHGYSSELPANTGEASRTDHKVDAIHEFVRSELAPRIQTMSANALLTDRREFYYYKMKKTGRRCSCYVVENSPNKQCLICFGTGIVGGFEKFGTFSETLDYTTPNLVMVNMEPTLLEDTRPVFFKLSDGFNTGYVEGVFPLVQNVKTIDTYMLYQPLFNHGAKIKAFDPTGASAYIAKCEDWEPFLLFDKVRVRVEFTRDPKQKNLFSHLYLRYKTAQKQIIFGDIPRSEENLSATQFGFIDAYSEITVFFDGKTVLNFENEDLLYRLSDGKRFKFTTINPNLVAGTLTSWDTRCRYLIPSVDTGLLQVLV